MQEGRETVDAKRLSDEIMYELGKQGFEALLVGGAVRNKLFNRYSRREWMKELPIKDYDITTNARYEDIERIFVNKPRLTVVARGESFKVAVVQHAHSNIEVEVASYRGESYPQGGSLRPNEVHYVDTFFEDSQRRDFTINAIAMDLDGKLIDHHGGFKDLLDRTIRTVGDPNKRFQEDPLRMLRAVRFAAQMGFAIDYNTEKAIKNNIKLLEIIPHSRVADEINKILNSNDPMHGFKLLEETDLIGAKFHNTTDGTLCQLLPGVKHEYAIGAEDSHTLIERWVRLLFRLGSDKARVVLEALMPLNSHDIDIVCWTINARNLVEKYNKKSLNIAMLELAQQCKNRYNLDKVMTHILHIYSPLSSLSRRYKKMINNIKKASQRPLFANELPFNGNKLMELTGLRPGPLIGIVQQDLLKSIAKKRRYTNRYVRKLIKKLSRNLPKDNVTLLDKISK